jgi:hypothetical protein
MFSPKYLVLGAIAVSLLLAVLLLSAPGAASSADAPAADPGQNSAPVQNAAAPSSSKAPAAAAPVSGRATLDLNALTRANTINETDNVRWSLVRGTSAQAAVYNAKSGVDWKALRTVTQTGTFALKAGSSFSFNQAFQEGVGYKQASGVLAGGQCALATVMRAAAIKAGLPTQAIPHKHPVPGFPQNETVTIWWGTYDLVIRNPTSQDLSIAWTLTPTIVTIEIK